jgi:hypothetical protein
MTKIKEKVPAIYSSLAKVQEELKPIAKGQQGYGYKFRSIDDVMCALSPLLKKYQIIIRKENLTIEHATRSITDKNGKEKHYAEAVIQCDYVFTSLIDGSEVRTSGGNGGQDSSGGDKAISMCYSNSYKYMLFELFCIPTDEQKDSDQVTAAEASKRGSAYRKKETDDVL